MILLSESREGSRPCRFSALVLSLTLTVSAALISGCADNNGRCSVSGSVTFEGQELKEGYLVLRPLGNGQTHGAKIRQGQYHIERENGLLPGDYSVEIKAMRSIGDRYIDSETGIETQDREQFLPAKYNSQTELRMAVTLEGNNSFDFELEN